MHIKPPQQLAALRGCQNCVWCLMYRVRRLQGRPIKANPLFPSPSVRTQADELSFPRKELVKKGFSE